MCTVWNIKFPTYVGMYHVFTLFARHQGVNPSTTFMKRPMAVCSNL